MSELLTQAQAIKEHLVDLRRELHRHPELALEEYRTAALIRRELDRLEVPYQQIGETGILATVQGAQNGDRSVALRADIDALPIEEENQVEYRSQNPGVMHACGHDAHTTCLLGAAQLLMAHRDRFGGQVRLIFQPGEETGKGAMDFIQAGALEGVDRAMALHVESDLPLYTLGIKPGLNKAAVDHFRILVHGKATHVSTPELGADALYAASQIVVAIQGLVARRISPTEPIILGIGKFEAGTTYNAVAEYAELEGTTRTISEEMRMQVREWIDLIVHENAHISGAEGEVIWTSVCSTLFNDPQATAEVTDFAQKLDQRFQIVDDRPLSLGGDNFGEYERLVPGCYVLLGTSSPDRPDTWHSIHNCHFDIDEAALPVGAALYAECAIRWLSKSTAD
jgi:amidohydrolase